MPARQTPRALLCVAVLAISPVPAGATADQMAAPAPAPAAGPAATARALPSAPASAPAAAPASPASVQAMAGARQRVAADDRRDFADARRGFIATRKDPVLRDAAGKPSYNLTDYDFLQGSAPPRANAAVAASTLVSGSTTIQPLPASMNETVETSKPRT